MIKKTILASVGAVVALTAVPASAATLVFVGGTGGLTAGQTDYANFDSTFGNIVFSSGVHGITSGTTFAVAAEPAYGDQGDDYYYVSQGGQAEFGFGLGVGEFGFDLGSADDYNTLTVFFSDGTNQSWSGAGINPPGPATGNQEIIETNGRVTVFADGKVITAARFISGQPSFEFDNIGVAPVPEPTTWALFILGFGGMGFAMRRRNAKVRVAKAALHFA